METKDTGTALEPLQLLVVADTWCDPQFACNEVWQRLGERRGKVYVVTPVLASRLHTLTSDLDDPLAAAEQRLHEVLTQLREHGYIATGRVGDQDPLLAINDTLFFFQADEILVVMTATTDESWSEKKLFERAVDLGVPVSCVRITKAGVQ